MKIKKFTAANMNKLLLQVKKELGEDAVVISTSELPDGNIELIAAIENEDLDFGKNDELEISSAKYQDTFIRECLTFHEPTLTAQSQILANCRKIALRENLSNDIQILEKAFAQMFDYYSFFEGGNFVKMFMGMPGSGKSTALAKTAAIAKFKNIPTTIISTDNVRAGTNNQLQAFAEILNSDYVFVKNPENLYDKVLSAQTRNHLVLIDTAGVNPFISKDMDKLALISKMINCDKILTIDAGRNAYDAVEAADIFKALGANCLLPTKLDLTRRLGLILSLAVVCDLKLGYASVNSSIAQGIARVTNKSLASLILD